MKLIYEHKRIFGLDLMRAAAIFLVLIGHCGYFLPNNGGYLQQILSVFGFFGVEVFFVLSGFLIGKILLQMFEANFTLESAILFVKRRWFRTLPNYYLILLVNFFVAFYIGYEVTYSWRYFFFLQNFASPLLPFFPESWSLSIEEYAYLILPFSLLIAAQFSNKIKQFVTVTLALIIIIQILKFAYNANNPATTLMEWNVALKSVVIYRLDAIFFGVLASVAYVKRNEFWLRWKYSSAIIGSVLFLLLFIGVGYFQISIQKFPMFWNIFYLPLNSLAVLLFLPLLSEWRTVPNIISKPITIISVLSYSMYLLHYSIVLQLMRHHFDLTNSPSKEYIYFGVAYFVITISLSYILYRFYEKPMTDLRESAGTANLERFFPLSRFYKKR